MRIQNPRKILAGERKIFREYAQAHILVYAYTEAQYSNMPKFFIDQLYRELDKRLRGILKKLSSAYSDWLESHEEEYDIEIEEYDSLADVIDDYIPSGAPLLDLIYFDHYEGIYYLSLSASLEIPLHGLFEEHGGMYEKKDIERIRKLPLDENESRILNDELLEIFERELFEYCRTMAAGPQEVAKELGLIDTTVQDVRAMLEDIDSVLYEWKKKSIEDKWITMTLALNTAHHNGVMAEKIGLSLYDFDRKNYLQTRALTELGELRLDKTASLLLLLDMYDIDLDK